MTDVAIYRDIAERTQGDIYIGDDVIIGLNRKSQIKRGFEGLVLFFLYPFGDK